jgi:hypothetical protein
MNIEEMFEVVKDLNAEMLSEGDEIFKRVIKFSVNGVSCWIEWWTNISYLSVGGRYINQIPFKLVEKDNYWPFYRNGLKFMDKIGEGAECVCYLAIKMLDWQEKRSLTTPNDGQTKE